MTKRVIVIEDCGTCPHKDHNGAFGKVSYIPHCNLAHCDLPYDTIEDHRLKLGLTAISRPGIPSWCPLSKYPEASNNEKA